MTWNYRIMKHKEEDEEWYDLREIYYDKSGRANGYTAYATTFVADTPEDLIESLEMALYDAKSRKIITAEECSKHGTK